MSAGRTLRLTDGLMVLVFEYGIPYSKWGEHDPVRAAPEPDRPGLWAGTGSDHRPHVAAATADPAERARRQARRRAATGEPRATFAVSAGHGHRQRSPRFRGHAARSVAHSRTLRSPR